MSKAVAEIAIGAGEIAGTILVAALPGGPAISAALLTSLISAGASLTLSGIGTMLAKGPLQGQSGNIRNPISPWVVIYGRQKVGGTIVFLLETGESDKYLHLVFVVACHPCQAVDYVLFDNKRVTLDTSGNSLSYQDSTSVIAHNQTVNIAHISRTNDVVTVVLSSAFPAVASTAAGSSMMDGDLIQIQNVTGDATLNGIYPISVLNSTTFTYISGGGAVSITGSGQAVTTFPDYGDTVHMEVALGTQSSGSPPFPGLLASGDTGSQGLWTSQHLLQGRTAVYLRLKYGGNTYASGMPAISFLVRGKNDIYDPRPSPATHGYSENAALCIADYLAQPTWGFKANYGTEIPLAPLISAANICDESVTLANGGTEPRYACNGQFPLTTKRGEVLQNLLTACGGRLTYTGGQFIIHPAAWVGATFTFGGQQAIPAGARSARLTMTATRFEGTYNDGYADEITLSINGGSNLVTNGSAESGMTGWTNTTGGMESVVYGTTITSGTFPNAPAPDVGTNFFAGGAGQTLSVSTQTISVSSYATPIDAGSATYEMSAYLGGFSNQDDNMTLALEWLDGSGTVLGSITLGPVTESDRGGVSSLLHRSTADTSATNALQYAAGPFQWKSKVALRDLYNGVKGTYVSPVNGWQSSDFPPYAQDAKHGYSNGPAEYNYDANLAADGGDRRWLDVQLPFTISTTMAQRLAKIELLRRRFQGSGTFAFNLAMYQITALDVVSFTLPILGWYDKLLEISAHRFTVAKDGDAILLGTELDVRETDSSIYDWNVSEELSPQGYSQGILPNPSAVSPPTAVSAVSNSTTAIIGADGIARSRILVTWTPPADGYVTNGGTIELQYQEVSSPPSTIWTALPSVAPNVTQAYIDSVVDTHSYLVQVRAVNAAGASSSWVQAGPVTVSGTSSAIPLTTIDSSGAVAGQILTWSGSAWVPSAAPTGGTGTTHSEPLTDENGNFIFAKGDVVTVVGVPN